MFNAITAQHLSTPPDGGNVKASVSEQIGMTNVTIHYDRPAVKGRQGKIWGQLVHYGFKDLDYGTSKSSPWRAGANENTTITFSTDVTIENQALQAGTYAIFMAMEEGAATIIFSKNNASWGSYFYDEKEDALRVKVKTEPLSNMVERLSYDFSNQTISSAIIALSWENLRIPFKIDVDLVKTQLASFRNELRGDKGEAWQVWAQAANYCIDKNTNLEEGLTWADYALNGRYVGEKNFKTLSTKAQILTKLNKSSEADALMKEALPMGKMGEIHAYARQLLTQKRNKEALEVFKMNYDKNPNEYTTLMGITRGYSAIGDYKKALGYAEKALLKAPNDPNKKATQEMIDKLKAGKDAN